MVSSPGCRLPTSFNTDEDLGQRRPQVLEAHALPLRVEAALATPEEALVQQLEAAQPVLEPLCKVQEAPTLPQEWRTMPVADDAHPKKHDLSNLCL